MRPDSRDHPDHCAFYALATNSLRVFALNEAMSRRPAVTFFAARSECCDSCNRLAPTYTSFLTRTSGESTFVRDSPSFDVFCGLNSLRAFILRIRLRTIARFTRPMENERRWEFASKTRGVPQPAARLLRASALAATRLGLESASQYTRSLSLSPHSKLDTTILLICENKTCHRVSSERYCGEIE